MHQRTAYTWQHYCKKRLVGREQTRKPGTCTNNPEYLVSPYQGKNIKNPNRSRLTWNCSLSTTWLQLLHYWLHSQTPADSVPAPSPICGPFTSRFQRPAFWNTWKVTIMSFPAKSKQMQHVRVSLTRC
jgi:hypothetical protein